MKRRKQKAWTSADIATLMEEYNNGRAIVYIAMRLDRSHEAVKHEIRILHDKGKLKYRDNSWKKGKVCKVVASDERELPMSDEEIRRRHKNAIDPEEHITILAQCNGCSRSRIKEILKKDDAT